MSTQSMDPKIVSLFEGDSTYEKEWSNSILREIGIWDNLLQFAQIRDPLWKIILEYLQVKFPKFAPTSKGRFDGGCGHLAHIIFTQHILAVPDSTAYKYWICQDCIFKQINMIELDDIFSDHLHIAKKRSSWIVNPHIKNLCLWLGFINFDRALIY